MDFIHYPIINPSFIKQYRQQISDYDASCTVQDFLRAAQYRVLRWIFAFWAALACMTLLGYFVAEILFYVCVGFGVFAWVMATRDRYLKGIWLDLIFGYIGAYIAFIFAHMTGDLIYLYAMISMAALILGLVAMRHQLSSQTDDIGFAILFSGVSVLSVYLISFLTNLTGLIHIELGLWQILIGIVVSYYFGHFLYYVMYLLEQLFEIGDIDKREADMLALGYVMLPYVYIGHAMRRLGLC